jgi:hypothetical protein
MKLALSTSNELGALASIPLLHAQTSVLPQKEEEGVYGAFERAFLHISSYENNEHKVTLWVGESHPTPLASSQDNVCDVVDLRTDH